jgi:hypothetical protein
MSRRARLLLALVLVVPAGFATKFYSGPGQEAANNYLGGVLYEVFWVWFVLLLRPRWPAWRVGAGVLLATSVLEAMQLWHPPVLEAIRATFLGRTLIGTTFSWWDFPCYLAGCAVGTWTANRLLPETNETRRAGASSYNKNNEL